MNLSGAETPDGAKTIRRAPMQATLEGRPVPGYARVRGVAS